MKRGFHTKWLSEAWWRDAHAVLLNSGFPNTPIDYKDTKMFFERDLEHMLGLFINDELIGVLLFFYRDSDARVLVDIAIKEEYHKRWATRKRLNEIRSRAFSVYDVLWCYVQGDYIDRLLQYWGFVLVRDEDNFWVGIKNHFKS